MNDHKINGTDIYLLSNHIECLATQLVMPNIEQLCHLSNILTLFRSHDLFALRFLIRTILVSIATTVVFPSNHLHSIATRFVRPNVQRLCHFSNVSDDFGSHDLFALKWPILIGREPP